MLTGSGHLGHHRTVDHSTIFDRNFVRLTSKLLTSAKSSGLCEIGGAAGGTRTHDQLVKSQLLWPTELPQRKFYGCRLPIHIAKHATTPNTTRKPTREKASGQFIAERIIMVVSYLFFRRLSITNSMISRSNSRWNTHG